MQSGSMDRRTTTRRITRLATVGLSVTLLASCSQQQATTRATVQPRDTRPVLHAVYADDLRAAMRDLNRDASEQAWQQIYTGSGPVVDMAQVARLADNMAQVASTRIPQAVATVQMDPQERQVFLDLAQRLHDESVVLKQQAQRDQLAPAQASMNRVINTCNACHTMFRDVAGPMAP